MCYNYSYENVLGGKNVQSNQNVIKIITVSAVIFICLLVVALVSNLIKLASVNNRKAELEAELVALEQTIAQNDQTLDFMATDEYVDQYGREFLDLIGKDEQPFKAK